MSAKLIGFFDRRDQAEAAKQDLIAAGYDRGDVRLYEGKDEPGFLDTMREWFGFADEEDRYLYEEAARRGATAVLVDLQDADSPGESQAVRILQQHTPIDLDRRAIQWKTQGWQPQATATMAKQSTATMPKRGSQTIPVVEENLQVGKRQILTGGVRLHTHVVETPVEKQVQLHREQVTVERHPTDRPLAGADRPFQERTIEVTETSEEPVVSKQARVVEEVVVGKTAQDTTQTVRDKVRRTDVQVEKLSPQQPQFADQFASELASDTRYRGRDWPSMEPEARRSFEQRYPGSKWDQFKDAIHRGYDRVRQKV